MRSRKRSKQKVRKVPPERRPYARRRKPLQRAAALARGLITTVVLVGAGALIGLFWEEWRDAPLAEFAPAEFASVEPAPATPLPNALPEESSPGMDLQNRIKVEVLNGVGETGLARDFADRLRERGLDVVATANADHFEHGVTHVLDRSGRLGAAPRVAAAAGTDSVAVALDPDLFLDVSVVVGSDWREVLGRN